jgi:hypothetical protein
MPSQPGAPKARRNRRDRQIRPCVAPLESRVVPAPYVPGAAGVAIDPAGDVFVSYNSAYPFSGQQSVEEFDANGDAPFDVFSTSGASAIPGALTIVGLSISLPSIGTGDILELQPNGQLFDFNPESGSPSQFDNLASYTPNASNVYDIQTGAYANLTSNINLANATFGDFGVYGNAIVVSAESNNWDFVMRVSYASSSAVATVLVASPASDGLSASPEGVAVDTQGEVLATLPYVPAGSGTAIHVPVEFSLNFDSGGGPAPLIPTLGLTTTPAFDSSAIAVDSQNNFILAVSSSSLFSGPGVAHINSALTAFLADPIQQNGETAAAGIACQDVSGQNELALSQPQQQTLITAGELPLFSGQVTPAQLRSAYGVNQISFTKSNGQTVTGDGTGETIAIIEQGIDPTLGADLTTFDNYFGIAGPPGGLQQVNMSGAQDNTDIVGEASLDVEWAHAIAPGASIVVYNAAFDNNPRDPNAFATSFKDFMAAVQAAASNHSVSVVSMSYGFTEADLASVGINEQSYDSIFTTPGITFLAASGDTGIYGDGSPTPTADYPAASPNVIAVGGTSITIDSNGDYPGTGPSGEVAWGDGPYTGPFNPYSGSLGGGGGGLSAVENEPSWQKGVVPSGLDSSNARAIPDVSMDSGADDSQGQNTPQQPYDVFASTLSGSSNSADAVGWLGDAGTSAASPIWAGLIAIADQGRALAGGAPLTGYNQTLPALYSIGRNLTAYANDFHDITGGNNGEPAGTGYDLASGLGTPVANLLIPAIAGYGLPSQFSIKTEPPANVDVNATFGLTVQVEDSLGNPASGGTVTVAMANNPGGSTFASVSEPVQNGLATFSNLSLNQPGSGYTLTVTDSTIAGSPSTNAINVAPSSKAPATLSLSGLNYTYDGSTHTAVVTTSPAGLPGVSVTYTENGSVVANPTHAGDYTVTASLNNANYTATPVTGTLVIGQATPVISWAAPANITAGTKLSSLQLDATASFDGAPLAGAFNYTPAIGTLLGVGNNQTLMLNFVPTDSKDFSPVTSSVKINVLSPSNPPPKAMIIGETPVFQREVKNHKAVNVLTGFTLDYNMALAKAAVSNPNNYQLGKNTIERVKNKVVRVLQPITNFTVTYSAASHSVTIHLAGQSFPSGGKLTVRSGITAASGSILSGNTVFTISAGGKTILP